MAIPVKNIALKDDHLILQVWFKCVLLSASLLFASLQVYFQDGKTYTSVRCERGMSCLQLKTAIMTRPMFTFIAKQKGEQDRQISDYDISFTRADGL